MNGIEFSFDGLGLMLLAMGLVSVELVVNKWIRKVTNTYWFWLTISIFYITYCIAICWANYWNNFSHASFIDPTKSARESEIISKAFMLNICPFLNFALPICLIADPSRKTARSFAPLAVVSSLMVVILALPMTKDIKFNWHNIFVGTADTVDLFFFGHTANLLIGLGVMLNSPKFGWKGATTVAGAVTGFYLYVIIIAYSLGARWQVAGITLNDFGKDGTFEFFKEVFGNNCRLSQAVFFILLIVFLFGTILLCDICKRKHFAYGDKYSGCWWRYYDYEKTTIKEPWGWFSHNWQLKHKKNIR